MYFINFRKKFSFSFPASIVVLLLVASATLGTISSAAFSTDRQEQSAGISFSSLNPANFFNGNSFAQPALGSQANQSDEDTVFDEFDAWIDSYVKASGKSTFKADDEQTGAALAIRRREILKQLIAVNPQAALARAIPAETFNRLPAFITENSEKRISAEGDFLVYAVEANNRPGEDSTKRNKDVRELMSASSRTERTVVIGETKYKAYVYGRRAAMPTKLDIPLQGIIIDDAMAVDESPSRVIGSVELGGQSAMQESQVAAEIGGKFVRFSGQAELANFNKEQIEWESKIGAVRGAQVSNQAGSEKDGSPQEQTLSPGSTADWTIGTKKILVILVDFPDKPGFPVGTNGQQLTQERAQALYANEISPFYANNSYNKTSLLATVTPLIHLTKNQSYYTQGDKSDELREDARNAARAAGGIYNTDNFDLDSICITFSNNLSWVGIGYIGLKGNLLNGAFTAPEISHELGHNYGLPHANLWRTTDGSIIGQGNHIEYGDCFDTMSAFCNAGPQSHFNARYKRLLNWLTDANVLTVTSNDTYPLFAQDSPTPGGIRALKIQKDDNRSYWIEFRQQFTNNSNAMNGAIIHWDYVNQEFPGTDLLDMTPATTLRGDEPLVSGQTFNDYNSGIKITVVGRGNTSSPAESLNIKVEFTQFSCTYSLSSSSGEFPMNNTSFGNTDVITVGNNCPWTATTTDPWITINEGSGNGNGNVSFTLSSNNGGPPRTGTITVAGQTFTVRQDGLRCNGYTNLPSSFTIPASGGDLIYTPNSEYPCGNLSPDFDGTSSWIDISASPVKVLPNNIGIPRYGNLKLTAHDFFGAPYAVNIPVSQAAAPAVSCTYPLSPTSLSFTSTGGGGAFSIKSPNSACSTTYSITNNNSWITISNPSGQSNDNINYTVAANSGVARTGTITVNNPVTGSQTLTVTQGVNKSKRIRISF